MVVEDGTSPARPESFRGMPLVEVMEVVAWLGAHGATYQVNGGWAVDALAGRQTRAHRDLDVFLDEDAVAAFVAWLGDRGYVLTEDQLPVRAEYASEVGRVDVHPMALQPDGDGLQQGFGDATFRHRAADRVVAAIGGRTMVVATADRLRELREGYPLRPEDLHDLEILRSTDGDGHRPD